MSSRNKKSFKAIDLFAGVGGMSLGAARAGFDLTAAVELDRIAIETHATNFPNSSHLRSDVGAIDGKALLRAAGLKEGKLDGLIGGPPCQGFSEIGRRNDGDPRNELFSHFFRLVSEIRPRFFLAENVPGILAERNQARIESALSRVPSRYRVLAATEVAAHKFGAATTRARVFFFGYDPNEVGALDEAKLFADEAHAPTTVGLALAGLPTVRSDWQSAIQGWREVRHIFSTKRPFYKKLIDAIPKGVGSSDAIARLREKSEVSGNLGTRHAEDVVRRFKALEPGRMDAVSRAPRLVEHGFCPTLRAGTGADRGSYQAVRPIHHKSPRVITPREAARLQGFPDWFQFHETKWHSFRQIGNSVSPLVAEGLLSRVRKALEAT